jgi:hypothetical protein
MAGPRAFALLGALAALAACATQSAAAVAPAAPGFLLGLWHGFIFPIAWVISLFVPEVAVYAVPNSQTPARRLTGWSAMPFATASFLGIAVFGIGARKSHVVYRDRVIRERVVRGTHIIREVEE